MNQPYNIVIILRQFKRWLNIKKKSSKYVSAIFNRPGIAGADLNSPMLLIHQFIQSVSAFKVHMQKKDQGRIDCNKKREDFHRGSLPTMICLNHLSSRNFQKIINLKQ